MNNDPFCFEPYVSVPTFLVFLYIFVDEVNFSFVKDIITYLDETNFYPLLRLHGLRVLANPVHFYNINFLEYKISPTCN